MSSSGFQLNMLSRFATAAAVAPLVLASAAHAQVDIGSKKTAPILTSTVSSGSAADVTVSEDGSVVMTGGVAITGDSDNDIVLEEGSLITMDEAEDGDTGILLEAGNTGDLTMGGAISITDDIDSYEDEDDDGDYDGPFASGSDRYGIRVAGDGVRTGDITVEDTGSIAVQGDDSAGISIESALDGDLTVLGSVSVTGDNGVGVRIAGDVDGDILLSGSSISVTGEDSVGVSVENTVSGALQIQSSVTSNGYRYTYQPTSLADLDEDDADDVDLSDDSLYLEDLDEDDLLQAGSAVKVTASIGGGILLGAAPSYEDSDGEDGDDDRDGVDNGDEDDDGDGTINSDDDDRDGDGILDENEGTSSITTYGAAPALAIGAETGDIVISAYGDSGYGLINEGSITASGIFDDIDGTAVLIGGGTGSTLIEGGILNDGSITAGSSEANATALRLSSGASTPALVNSGSITATATTEGLDTATGVLIDADAGLTSIVNSGTISTYIYGEAGDAVAIRDSSGTVTSLTNTGGIFSYIVATDNDDDDETDDEEITGHTIAIDFSANTTGVTITQSAAANDLLSDYDGDGLYDDEDTDDDDDGILDEADDDDNDDDNDGVADASEPYIVGDILLGSGADVVDIQNGYVIGDISFGSGADSFTISGGAVY